jgi:hypothetical protein
MRIREVFDGLAQFGLVQEACSREWRISDTLVMCVELDMAALAKAPTVAPGHSVRKHCSFIRLSFVRFSPGGAVAVCDDDIGMPAAERERIAAYQDTVRRWLIGGLETNGGGLPESDSTRVASQYRR